MRASSVVNRQSMLVSLPFRSFFHAATLRRRSGFVRFVNIVFSKLLTLSRKRSFRPHTARGRPNPTSLTKTAEKSTENAVSYRCNKAVYVLIGVQTQISALIKQADMILLATVLFSSPVPESCTG